MGDARFSLYRLLQSFIRSWLTQDKALFLSLLHRDVHYSESHGPVYVGRAACERWFAEWNARGKVLEWTIDEYCEDANAGTLSFEWTFRCLYDGAVAGFRGASFMTVSGGEIVGVREYRTADERTYPCNPELGPDGLPLADDGISGAEE